MKILERVMEGVSIKEMKDGDIGEIVSWTGSDKIGLIVQRYKNILITLGSGSGSAFPSPFESVKIEELRVRILKKGTKLEI